MMRGELPGSLRQEMKSGTSADNDRKDTEIIFCGLESLNFLNISDLPVYNGFIGMSSRQLKMGYVHSCDSELGQVRYVPGNGGIK